MKRKIVCLLAAVLLLTVCLSGCGNTGMTEEIDETKTQLYVANYDGGVGEEWLRETADLFEEKYKDTEFEPGTGKRGVQIFIDTQEVYAGSGLSAIMRGSAYSIFFGEQLRYYDLASQGYVLDITDVVTESLQDISGENTTIEAKLSPARREALKVGGKYYGLPHYELYPGVTYDKDLFQTKALYIKEGGGYTNQASEMTVGPDGVRGSYDDGLPSSYEEFFALCAQMRRVGVTPFIWSGDYYHYFDNLLLGLFVNSASASEIEVNFTFNSGSDTVPIVTGFNGEEPIVEEKAVTPETGYLMSQSYSKYMALDFGQRVFAGSYYDSNSTNGTFSHTDAQETYIYSALENKPVAMLIEGTHWYNEATRMGVFERTEQDYADRGKAENRHFAFMPLPWKMTGTVAEGEGKKLTLADTFSSYAVLNADLSEDANLQALAKLFLKFCYTDEALQLFTETTGVVKGVNYSLGSDRVQNMNSYAQSVYMAWKAADVACPIANNDIFMRNQDTFGLYLNSFFSTSAKGGFATPYSAFKDDLCTVKEYFEGMAISEQSWHNIYA